MADQTSNLADDLAGAFGRGVNRPALNAQVATSQAMNGLRSAQTEEALINAQNGIREQQAQDELEGNLTQMYQSQGQDFATAATTARAISGVMRSHYGNFQQAAEGWKVGQSAIQSATEANPNADPNARAAAALAQGHNPYTTVEGQLVPNAQRDINNPTIIQTPGSIADQNAKLAEGALHGVQAARGGWNPNTGANAISGLPPEMQDAITRAVNENRLDPLKINSRNAAVLAGIELRNPGQTNFNQIHAQATLQANPTFQQKAINLDAMPTILQHMTTLGKQIGYSDVRTIGKMQQFMNGELNDPQYTEYMAVRNDALMNIASLMRGVGMSDQAHRAEMEAAAPTLSPLGLDAWLKGQMATLKPRMDAFHKITHMGEPGTTNAPAPNSPANGGGLAAAATAELARRAAEAQSAASGGGQ